MKNFTLTLALALLASTAWAQTPERTDGVVRKIDKEAKKITIRHGEIKSLGMPPMTMVFQVQDVAALDRVKPGDTVQFSAGKSNDGAYMASDIQPATP